MCCSCCKHESTCFDLIRNNRIFRTVKFLHTVNTDGFCTCATNVCSHAVQEVCNINDVGFSCSIINNGLAFRERCCHQNIDGGTNRNLIQIDMSAFEFLCLGRDQSIADINICAQRLEALDVKVNRSGSDVTSAGKCYFCATILTKKSAEKIIRSTNLLNIFIINRKTTDRGSIDLNDIALDAFNMRTDILDCTQKHVNITYVRYITDNDTVVSHYCGSKNCQSRVLRSTNLDIALQRRTAFYHILFHELFLKLNYSAAFSEDSSVVSSLLVSVS